MEFINQFPGGLQQVLDECDEKMPGLLPPGPEAVFKVSSHYYGAIFSIYMPEISKKLLDSIGETESNQKPIQISLGFNQDMHPEGIDEYCFFTNYFICSSRCHNNLEKVFIELKNEL